jgi:L-fuconolactonase
MPVTASAAVVDIHPHVISADTERYPLDPIGGRQSDWSRERPVDLEGFVAAADAAGVSKAVLVQASTCYGHDSSYVADSVAAWPDRFAGVFSCDILSTDAVADIDRWVARGLSGMRVFTTGSTMPGQQKWLDDPRTYPAWARAEELRVPVCLQMTAAGIEQLESVLDRFRDLRVILDHMARPVYEDGPPYHGADSLWGLGERPNVYVKVTERNLVGATTGQATPETFFGKLVGSFGADRVAWGSNFPASKRTLPELIELARATLGFLPAADLDWIFAGTAKLLYPSLADD